MNEIADELPLSKGSVHKIIKEWRSSPQATDVDDIRIFMAEVRKSGINITECIEGFRILNILKKFGVYDEFEVDYVEEIPRLQTQAGHGNVKAEDGIADDNKDKDEEISKQFNSKNRPSTYLLDQTRSAMDTAIPSLPTNSIREIKSSNSKGYQINYFINDIYKNCKSHDVSPTIIVEWIKDLFYFCSVLQGQSPKVKTIDYHSQQEQGLIKSNENGIPKEDLFDIKKDNEIPLLSKITFFIEQKAKEIHHLVNKRNSIVEEINSLNEQNKKLQTQLSNTVEKEKKVISYLQWYSNLREDLRNRFNLKIEQEFEVFANVINDLKEYGHNPSILIKEYKEFGILRHHVTQMRDEIKLKQKVIQDLLKEISNLEIKSYIYKQTMSTFEELKNTGLGLKELKQLKGLITEVSAANNIHPTEALQRFLIDLEKNYDNRLGLESKIKLLQIEIEHLNNKVQENQYHLLLQNAAAPNLVTLYSKGLTNNDIIDITNLVLALENSYSLDYKAIRKDNEYYSDKIDIISRNEFWKLVIKKFKDLGSINSEIEKAKAYINDFNKKNKIHDN
jgi:hypothetical protein